MSQQTSFSCNEQYALQAEKLRSQFELLPALPGLFFAVRTPFSTSRTGAADRNTSWNEFLGPKRTFQHGRHQSRTGRPFEWCFFGHRGKMADYTALALQAWGILPIGDVTVDLPEPDARSYRDMFTLSLLKFAAYRPNDIPLDWDGDGPYSVFAQAVQPTKLLGVFACLHNDVQREDSEIEFVCGSARRRVKRPSFLYVAVPVDVGRAATFAMDHLSEAWRAEKPSILDELGLISSRPNPVDEYLQSDLGKRNGFAHALRCTGKFDNNEIRAQVNQAITTHGWQVKTLNSPQAVPGAWKHFEAMAHPIRRVCALPRGTKIKPPTKKRRSRKSI